MADLLDSVNPAPAADPAPAANPAPAALINEAGEFAENWREHLPDDLRGEKCLDNVKNLTGLVKSFVSGQKMIGAARVAIPGENATPEEIDAFQRACGRPEKVGDYATDKIELPEGIELSDDEVEQFRQAAFAMGLSQKAFETALKFDVERVQRAAQAHLAALEQERSDTEARLKSEFGAAYGDNIALARSVLERLGLNELAANKNLGSNYAFIKALVAIGKDSGESRQPGSGSQSVVSDPAARLAEITGNLADPYHQTSHPQHEARVREVEALVRALSA